MTMVALFTVCGGSTLSTRWRSLLSLALSSVQLVAPRQSLQPTGLILVVRRGDQFIEEHVGVAAANLTGGNWADPALNTPHTGLNTLGDIHGSFFAHRGVNRS